MRSRLASEQGRVRPAALVIAGLVILATAGLTVVVITARGPIPLPVRSTDSTGLDVAAAGVPDVAVVSCGRGSAEAHTPIVRAQPDGVHLIIHGSAVYHVRDPETPGDDVGGSLLARGSASVRRDFPPGDLWIGCLGEPREEHPGFQTPPYHRVVAVEHLVRLTVIDPPV